MLKTITVARNRLFSLVYKNKIEFFTNVSITASIYLLTVSGIDRLLPLVKPLYYNQNVAKRFATSSLIVCWILGIFVSVLPTFISGFLLSKLFFFFFFFYLYIYPPDSQESDGGAIHRVSNYPDLLP